MKAEENYEQDVFYTCQITCSSPLSQDTAEQSMNVTNETKDWRQQKYEGTYLTNTTQERITRVPSSGI